MHTLEENILLNYLSEMPFFYREKLDLPNEIKFGIEIEFMANKKNEIDKSIKKALQNQNGNKKNFKLAHSNRITSDVKNRCIYEIKSPVMNNTKEDFKCIEQICNSLKNKNVMPSNQKGIHVHADLSMLEGNEEYLKTLLKIFCIYEHIIFRFSFGEEDYSNINISSYSREISTKLYHYLKYYESNMSFAEHISRLRTVFNSKSYALNFHKKDFNCKNDTIEFRTFNSTINPVIIQNNINFVLHFIDQINSDRIDIDLVNYRMNDYKPENYITESYSDLYLDDAIEFSELIFNSNIDRDYFLRQYAIKSNPKIKKLVI